MNLLAHRGRISFLAAALLAGVAATWPEVVHAQAGQELRGSIEETDAAADRFGDPAEPDPDASEDAPQALLLPEDAEAQLSGDDEAVRSTRRARRVRSADGRLVPSQPGQGVVANRTGRVSQQRARRVERAPQVGVPQNDGTTVPQGNVAQAPVQSGTLDPNRPGPFDPLGKRLGPLRVVTTIEQSLGVTSNAEFKANGAGSGLSETRVDAVATTDWAVHELRGRLSGSYRNFFSDAPDLPTLDAEAAFRYDLRRDTALTLGANWAVASESATDDSILGAAGVVDERPLVQAGDLFVEAERTGGRLFGRLRGSIGRELYGDIEFADGSSRSQSDREATLFETALRLGYAHTPAFQPFIEGEIGYRLHDEREDSSGQNRDAARYALRGGFLLDLNEKITGSFSAGVESVVYESNRFDTLVGPSVEAALTWSPDRLTQIDLTASTLFDDSVTEDVGGRLDYRFALSANREVRENLAAFGSLTLGLRDPGGSLEETSFGGEVGLAWSLNRALALTGRLNYFRVDSKFDDADYDVQSATVGLRWQK